MNKKKILTYIVLSFAMTLLVACDVPENSLRAKANTVAEKPVEKPSREKETEYGSAISEEFKKAND